MVFGRKELFAVEAELTQGNEYIFAQYCYWVKNHTIGDFDQLVLLGSAIQNFKDILTYKGRRNIAYDTISSEGLAKLLLDGDNKDEQVYIDEELIFYLNLNYSKSENMDGYYTFLIETKSYEWLLCGDTIAGKNYEVKVPKDQFYKYIEQVLNWITQSTLTVLRTDNKVE